MIDVAFIRPSDIMRLRSSKLDDKTKKEILRGIEVLLNNVTLDDGAETDRLTSSAESLSMAGVWDQIPAEELASYIVSTPRDVMRVFLTGIPRSYAEKVSYHVLQAEEQTPKVIESPVAGRSFASMVVRNVIPHPERGLSLVETKMQNYRLKRAMARAASSPLGMRTEDEIEFFTDLREGDYDFPWYLQEERER